ncbi:MAG: hypothetical protein EPN93_08350 [Spirochaetes bacterium]|nr:MAG: hypothetical protein EPN93_08350 [Spirochaetota bacterium]
MNALSHEPVVRGILYACVLVLATLFRPLPSQAAERLLVGVAGIEARNPRAANIASLTGSHLANVLASAGVFSVVNQAQLERELNAFGCTDEPCLLRFARTAGLSLLVRGRIESESDAARLELSCYAMDAAYNGKLVYRYSARIALSRPNITARELGYLSEEHAGAFIAGVLRAYRHPYRIRTTGGRVTADTPSPLNGRFTVYRTSSPAAEEDAPRDLIEAGELEFQNGSAKLPDRAAAFREGDFILQNFTARADYLDEFYRGRKKELVFESHSPADTIYIMLFGAPASVSMPLMAPLGYYVYGDYAGLGLWAVNVSPWLYLEADGFLNRPSKLREDHRDISRTRAARYDFALYMALSGGIPLFVDAFAHQYLRDAAEYSGTQPIIGNPWSAAFLALASPGGGHFYRGSRAWGYFYFHLDNLLVYSILNEFAHATRYDAAGEQYARAPHDHRRGYTLLYALAAVKLVEIVHAVLTPDAIYTGEARGEELAFQPSIYRDERGHTVVGGGFALRF